ncbi:MAG TPA: hypothetical protein VJ985_07945 [Gammaproteobacteria bacterium]|nr:hypothetical protein [Gammaproteobacteria bacterium]
MKGRHSLVVLAAGALLVAAPVQAQERDRDERRMQDRVYGAQLMTPAERAAYRERLRNLPPGERAELRAEHRREMNQRARERGVRLGPRGGAGDRQGPGMGSSRNGGGFGGGGGR